MIRTTTTKKGVWDEIEELKKQEKRLVFKVQELNIEIGSIRESIAELMSTDWKYPFEISI